MQKAPATAHACQSQKKLCVARRLIAAIFVEVADNGRHVLALLLRESFGVAQQYRRVMNQLVREGARELIEHFIDIGAFSI